MVIRQLTSSHSVADQITLADLEDISKAGFRSIICNRPDEEGEPHDDAYSMAQHAAFLDLEFRYQPVDGSRITDDDAVLHANLLSELPTPILAYCHSGTRCTKLWALTQKEQQSADTLLKISAIAGINIFDIAGRL